MIFQMSRTYGKHLIQSVAEIYDKKGVNGQAPNIREHIERVSKLGWGAFTYGEMEFREGRLVVNLNENIFREDCKTGRNEVCYFIRGVLVGTMEEISGQEISVKKTNCYKDGASNCVFTLQRN